METVLRECREWSGEEGKVRRELLELSFQWQVVAVLRKQVLSVRPDCVSELERFV